MTLPSATPPSVGAGDRHPYLDKEARKIRHLFDRVAPRYDLLNHLLSLQLDRVWRRRTIAALDPRPGERILDVCTGTGDLALELARRAGPEVRVVGSDFSVPMLSRGRGKDRGRRIGLVAGDTLRLPFADGTFDGVMVAFGIRNVEDLERCFAELGRVLRPGGRLLILEFTPVASPFLRPLFRLYNQGVVSAVGNLLSGSREKAYSYLQQSIESWPAAAALAARLSAAGYRDVSGRVLFPGNVALHRGVWAR